MLHRETFELQGLGAFMVALLVVKAWKCPCIRGWENSEEWTQHTKEGQQQWKQKAPSSDITPDAAQKQNTQGTQQTNTRGRACVEGGGGRRHGFFGDAGSSGRKIVLIHSSRKGLAGLK